LTITSKSLFSNMTPDEKVEKAKKIMERILHDAVNIVYLDAMSRHMMEIKLDSAAPYQRDSFELLLRSVLSQLLLCQTRIMDEKKEDRASLMTLFDLVQDENVVAKLSEGRDNDAVSRKINSAKSSYVTIRSLSNFVQIKNYRNKFLAHSLVIDNDHKVLIKELGKFLNPLIDIVHDLNVAINQSCSGLQPVSEEFAQNLPDRQFQSERSKADRKAKSFWRHFPWSVGSV